MNPRRGERGQGSRPIRGFSNGPAHFRRIVSESDSARYHPYPTSRRERNQGNTRADSSGTPRDSMNDYNMSSGPQANQLPPADVVSATTQPPPTFTPTETTDMALQKLKQRFGYRSKQQKPITSITRVPTCGNKDCWTPRGHTLAICPTPSRDSGFLKGCPLCNTTEHFFDYCEHVYRLTLDDLYGFLVENRNNKPPLSSIINPLALIAWKGKFDFVPMTADSARSGGWYGNWRRVETVFPVNGLQFANLVCSNWKGYTKQVTWTKTELRADLSLLDYDSSRGSIMNFVPVDIIPRGLQFIQKQGITWADEHLAHFERHLKNPNQSRPAESPPNPTQTPALAQTQIQAQALGPLSAPEHHLPDDEEELEIMKAHAARVKEFRKEITAFKETLKEPGEMLANLTSKPRQTPQTSGVTTRQSPLRLGVASERVRQTPIGAPDDIGQQRSLSSPCKRPEPSNSEFPESMYDD